MGPQGRFRMQCKGSYKGDTKGLQRGQNGGRHRGQKISGNDIFREFWDCMTRPGWSPWWVQRRPQTIPGPTFEPLAERPATAPRGHTFPGPGHTFACKKCSKSALKALKRTVNVKKRSQKAPQKARRALQKALKGSPKARGRGAEGARGCVE